MVANNVSGFKTMDQSSGSQIITKVTTRT